MLRIDDLAREAEIEVCGRVYYFARSLDMLRRAEGAVGPVAPFAERLDRRACRVDEIVRLYEALLRDTDNPPTHSQLEAWVFGKGLRHADLSVYLYSLTLGSDELERVSKARGLLAAQSTDTRRPFVTTAAPNGAGFSGSGTGWAGRQPNSGAARFSS